MKALLLFILLIPLAAASGADLFCSPYKDPFLYQQDHSPWNLTAKDFGKAARMEMIIERTDYAKLILDDGLVTVNDLREVVGIMYFNTVDFKNLFFENGVKVKLGETKQKHYMANLNFLKELEKMYHGFDEYTPKKMETRLRQIIKLHRNLVRGMQRSYIENT